MHFPLPGLSATCAMTFATSFSLLASSPDVAQIFDSLENVCVGVKNGATPFTFTFKVRATSWDARTRPTSACFEATYAPTPLLPKYPDVDVMMMTEPRLESEKHGSFFCMWNNANRNAGRNSVRSGSRPGISFQTEIGLTVDCALDVDVQNSKSVHRFL
jgi:hypothetical protein